MKRSANYFAIHGFIQPVFHHILIRNAHDPSPDIKAMFMFLSSTITLPDSASVRTYKYSDVELMSFAFTAASFFGREVAEVVVSRAIFRTKDFFGSLSVQSEFAPRRPLK